MDKVLDNLKTSIQNTIDAFTNQLAKVRTGRASPSILDGITVPYYGSNVPLNQVATINVPEPRMIILQPYDKSVLGEIEKAIHAANLGISPNNDGNIIRLPIPPLTEERRKEIAKSIRQQGEEAKISIRRHRKNALSDVKALEKSKELSEDDAKKLSDKIQELVTESTNKIEKLVSSKENEVLSL